METSEFYIPNYNKQRILKTTKNNPAQYKKQHPTTTT